jgi:DNA-binding MarR family transcriptional regulator
MSAAVQALCDLGWAAKTSNPTDARSSLVRLTEEGRATLSEARERRASVVAELFEADATTDEDDLATAVGVLRGLLSPDPRPDTAHRSTHQGVS